MDGKKKNLRRLEGEEEEKLENKEMGEGELKEASVGGFLVVLLVNHILGCILARVAFSFPFSVANVFGGTSKFNVITKDSLEQWN